MFYSHQLFHFLSNELLVVGGAGQDQGLKLGPSALRASVEVTLGLGQNFRTAKFNFADLKNES